MMEQKNKKPTKKQIDEAKLDATAYLENYKPSFDDDEVKNLYNQELPNFTKEFDKLKNQLRVHKDGELNQGEIKGIQKRFTTELYEKIFPLTTTYIKQRVFHGYDSKFYVCCVNSTKSFLAKEYTVEQFNSTYKTYFPEYIKLWFDLYASKYILTMNNERERFYKEDGHNYLNLFNGYRFSKHDKPDEEKIKRGSVGVSFIWNHIKDQFCSNDEQVFINYKNAIMKMICGLKIKILIYMKGKMGRGKGKITNFLKEVIGLPSAMTLSNDSCFMKDFNGALMGQALVVLDEICHDFNDFKSLYNSLKPYVTEPEMTYRHLYAAHKQLKNVSSFIMTGNHAMLRFEGNDAGPDRRILVCPMSNDLKSVEYCRTLDQFVASDDVQYSFFWYCQRNQVVDWNELEELKKIPISEEKKTMIQHSLDSIVMFLKSFVNDSAINKPIKPKDLFKRYDDFVSEECGKTKPFGKVSFMDRMMKFDKFITLNTMKFGGSTTTSYFIIDRQKLIDDFTENHYWAKYDDIHENPVPVPADEHDKQYDDIIQSQQQQIKKLNKLLDLHNEIHLMSEILSNIKSLNKNRIIPPLFVPQNLMIADSKDKRGVAKQLRVKDASEQLRQPQLAVLTITKDARPQKKYSDQVDALTAMLD